MQEERNHLLDLNQAAQFLNISKWTVRRLVDAGTLPVVRLPARSRTVKRLLFDKNDLVALVTQSKEVEPGRPDGS